MDRLSVYYCYYYTIIIIIIIIITIIIVVVVIVTEFSLSPQNYPLSPLLSSPVP